MFSQAKQSTLSSGQDKPTSRLRQIVRGAGRLMWCTVGAATGIGLALLFVGVPRSPFLLASLGGSAVFLFGLTRTPAAQPRALLCGHVGSAFIGIVCFKLFGDALWVYMLAVAITLAYMLVTKTVHPPAAANCLIMVNAHAGFASLWQPVGLGVMTLAIVATVWSRTLPGMVRYPKNWFEKSPASIHWGAWTE